MRLIPLWAKFYFKNKNKKQNKNPDKVKWNVE